MNRLCQRFEPGGHFPETPIVWVIMGGVRKANNQESAVLPEVAA